MATKSIKSTAVAVKAASSVVSIADMLRAQATDMAERTAPASGAAIRVTQDKKFSLPDGTKADSMDVVVIDFVSKNSFYEKSFDPKDITPPACFAIGTNPLKMVPSPNAPLPQATDCNSCPNNQWGSDGKGKACKNSRLLAVLPPDAGEDTPMWTLSVSPTASKGFDSFVTSVARVYQMPPVGVIAEVGFSPAVTYAQIVIGNPQVNPNVEAHFSRQDEARTMLNIEPDVSKFAASKPAIRGKAPTRR